MKTLMSTYEFAVYLSSKYPELSSYIKNGNIDESKEKCINVTQGSETRDGFVINVGGISCTESAIIPINILVHWTTDYQQCNELSNKLLLELQQVIHDTTEKRMIYCIKPLDRIPIDLGRKNNYCETMIRLDVNYKLEEEAI